MELFYRKTGSGSAFVILHGLYGSSDNWMSVARQLEDKYSVYMVDLRNHGQSPHSNTNTYDDMVTDLYEFVQRHQLDKIVLLGHSMGGKVAMLFALKYTDLVKKLIVVDIAPKKYLNASNFGQETTNHKYIISSLLKLNLQQFSTREAIDKALSEHLKASQLRSFLLKNIKRKSDGTFKWRLNLEVLSNHLDSIMDGFSGVELQSTVDALFVRGQNSPYIQLDDQFFINKFFPGSQVVTIPNTGHWVHAEQPKLLVNTIDYFLL